MKVTESRAPINGLESSFFKCRAYDETREVASEFTADSGPRAGLHIAGELARAVGMFHALSLQGTDNGCPYGSIAPDHVIDK